MGSKLEYSSEYDVLIARFSGTFTPETSEQYFGEIAAAAAKHPCRRFLNDIREAQWVSTISDMFYFPNKVIRETFDRSWRRALVVRQEDYDDIEFYEIAAVNKGLSLKIFTDYGEALAWLRELPAPGAGDAGSPE